VSGLRSVSQLVDPTRTLFRFQLAAGLVLLGLVTAFVSIKFQTETYLLTAPATRSPQSYSRIWFANQDTLAGANLVGGVLRVDRLPGEGSSFARTWNFPIGSSTLWTVASNLSYAAWVDGTKIDATKLYTQSLSDDNRKSTIQLPAKLPMGITVLPDASIAVVFSDASAARWDLNSGESLGDLHLPGLDTADQATLLDDYIAIASSRVHTIALYHFRNGQWVSMESLPAPEPPFQLAIPAAGTLATISSGHLRTGQRPRNTLGAVSSAVSFRGVAVVAGLLLTPARRAFRTAST